MAMLNPEQKEAFSSMNLSSHEERMKDLEAELEAVKARIAETRANIQNLKADKKLFESVQSKAEEATMSILPDRGLTGLREEDGSLKVDIPSAPDKGIIETVRDMTEDESKLNDSLMAGEDMTEELQIIANNMTLQDFEDTGMPIVDKSPLGYWDYTNNPNGEWVSNFPTSKEEDSIKKDEGRGLKGYRYPVPEKAMPGWKEDEGGNWSIDTESDYWSTDEGYDEAMRIYGFKPAWVHKPKKAGMVTAYKPAKRISL